MKTSGVRPVASAYLAAFLGVALGVSALYGYWAIFEHRFKTVTEGQVYRSAAMPPERLVAKVREHGIRTVIDLRDHGDDKRERAALAELGVNYFNLPTTQIPPPAVVDAFLQIVEQSENRPVLIHCQHGMGRAVLFSALYRIEFEGWSNERARSAAYWGSGLGSFGPDSKKGSYLLAYVRRRPDVVARPIADRTFSVAWLYGGIALIVAFATLLLHGRSWSIRRWLFEGAREGRVDQIWSAIYHNRNLLVCIPFVFALVSTRWEWENDWGIWPVAFLLCAAGIGLRGWALCFCPFGLKQRRKLAVAGPYASVRNPLYWANMLIAIGTVTASELVWLVPVVFGWSFAVYTGAVRHEERGLRKKYGDAYLRYCEEVPRWIPRRIGVAHGPAISDHGHFGYALLSQSPLLLVLLPFALKELNFLDLWPHV